MTSIKAAAAVVVVVIIVIAAAAVVVFNNNGNGGGNGGGGGSSSDSPVDAIGSQVEVDDEYTLLNTVSTSRTLGADNTVSTSTNYKVTGVYGDLLSVNVTTDGSTTPTPTEMSPDTFLGNVSVVSGTPVGDIVGTENINTGMGTVQCTIYRNTVSANDVSIEILEWIASGSNIIYKTQMTTTQAGETTVDTTSLTDTNMIEQNNPGSIIIPDTPVSAGNIRTDLQVGDYIEFTKYEHGWPETERFTITSINGDMVTYRERGDDDRERTSVENFLSIVRYNGNSAPITTETIETVFGNVQCNVYEYQFWGSVLDFDWEDRVVVWASVEDNTIYKIESTEDYYDYDDRWDHWYDDVESFYLTDTSLFNSAPSGGTGPVDPTPTPTPTPSQNRYGIELTVGDTYTISENNGRTTSVYEIIEIQGNRVYVKETESGFYTEVDFEMESANEFLGRIFATSEQLASQMYQQAGTGTVNGHNCTIYQERYDDDREAIWVQSVGNLNVIWQQADYWNGQAYDADVLVSYNIQSL